MDDGITCVHGAIARGAIAAASAYTEMGDKARDVGLCEAWEVPDGAPHIQGEELARFVETAGAVSGEAIYRWAEPRGYLPPLAPWADVSPWIHRWFDTFAKVAHALRPVPVVPAIVVAAEDRGAMGNATVHEKIGNGLEKAAGRLPAGAPGDTGGVLVVRNAPAPEQPQPAPRAADVRIGPGTLDRWAAGGIPTREELAAMEPEERRGFAALLGMPSAADLEHEAEHGSLGAAPEIDPDSVHSVEVDESVGGEKIAGKVAVAKVKGKK